MKIGIVSDAYYPHLSGTAEHIFHTSVELEKLGHEVKIITARYPGGSTPFDNNVIRLGKVVLVPVHGTRVTLTTGGDLPWQLRRTLDREEFDVVHIHGPLGPVLPLLCLILSKTVNVGTFHTQFDRSLAYSVSRALLNRWFRKLHGKIAVSKAARNSFSRHFPGDYRIIPNGVDVERFNPDKPKLEKLSHGRPTILYVGRLDPRKGLEHLLKAFPLILKDHPSARLIVVGGGRSPSYYRPYMDAKVDRHISFEGMVPPELIPSYYASCDVYCSPATGKESFGIVLLEAMASGIPVVASDIEGYRQVITDGRDGVLVEPGNPQAFAVAISNLLSHPEVRARLKQNGRATALQFSWERVTKLIEDYYIETRERAVWSSTH